MLAMHHIQMLFCRLHAEVALPAGSAQAVETPLSRSQVASVLPARVNLALYGMVSDT